MLKAILKAEVQAQVQLGQGNVLVTWEPQPERTTVSTS